MAKLSLCMISRFEDEKGLFALIEACGQYFDEIIVADTTKDELSYIDPSRNYHGNLKIVDYEWTEDFAAARNFVFGQATGDYIMWLDSDDTVINPENLPKLIEQMEAHGVDWMSLEYLYERDEAGNVIMRHWKPRIIRKGTEKWVGRIHESLEATQAIKEVRSDLVVIDHQMADRDKHTKESGERNLRILLKEFEETKDHPDPRTLFYLGNTLMGLQRFAEAIPFYMDHVKLCGWPEEKYYSLYYVAKCLIYLGRYDEAINISLEATKILPQWGLAYFTLAEAYANKEDFPKVIEWSLIGLERKQQDAHQYFIDDTEYELWPLVRLAGAYFAMHNFKKAENIAAGLNAKYPRVAKVKELVDTMKKVKEGEQFVSSFVNVATDIGNKDRIKAAKLFDCLPVGMDADVRIQAVRKILVPPKFWESNEIAIYCGRGNGEEWAQPSIYTGIGGSEAAVIHMSEQLVKLGWKVTVYNCCGQYRGTYSGVTYEPYYTFNDRDTFNVLIAWRAPMLFDVDLHAKKKIVWLHDIAYPQQFTDKSIANTDTFIFLSQWHRRNMPSIPDEKIFISNNGISLSDLPDVTKIGEKWGLIWQKSYDRGLLPFVRDIMPLVLKEVPETTLDVCYGWDTIDREIKAQPGIYPQLEALRADLTPLLEQDWITHHGRVSHQKVGQLTARALIHPYATEFGETNNIVSQTSQAVGTYVLTTTESGGTPEYLLFGEALDMKDVYTNTESQERYAKRLIELLKNPPAYTPEQLTEIRNKYSWEATATSWQKGLL